MLVPSRASAQYVVDDVLIDRGLRRRTGSASCGTKRPCSTTATCRPALLIMLRSAAVCVSTPNALIAAVRQSVGTVIGGRRASRRRSPRIVARRGRSCDVDIERVIDTIDEARAASRMQRQLHLVARSATSATTRATGARNSPRRGFVKSASTSAIRRRDATSELLAHGALPGRTISHRRLEIEELPTSTARDALGGAPRRHRPHVRAETEPGDGVLFELQRIGEVDAASTDRCRYARHSESRKRARKSEPARHGERGAARPLRRTIRAMLS